MLSELRRHFSAVPDHCGIRYYLAVIGDRGAIHFHFQVYGPDAPTGLRDCCDHLYPYQPWGVEVHTRCTLGDKPDHENCWLLNAPCKHDGSSLWAREKILPLFLSSGSDAVYRRLEARYRDEFESQE